MRNKKDNLLKIMRIIEKYHKYHPCVIAQALVNAGMILSKEHKSKIRK